MRIVIVISLAIIFILLASSWALLFSGTSPIVANPSPSGTATTTCTSSIRSALLDFTTPLWTYDGLHGLTNNSLFVFTTNTGQTSLAQTRSTYLYSNLTLLANFSEPTIGSLRFIGFRDGVSGGNYILLYLNNENAFFWSGDSNGNFAKQINTNLSSWHSYEIQWTNNSANLIVDGTPVVNLTTYIPSIPLNLVVGALSVGSNTLDNVIISSPTLSTLSNAEFTLNVSTPIAFTYPPFQQKSSLSVYGSLQNSIPGERIDLTYIRHASVVASRVVLTSTGEFNDTFQTNLTGSWTVAAQTEYGCYVSLTGVQILPNYVPLTIISILLSSALITSILVMIRKRRASS